jgi:hypothetical protein
MLKDLEAFFDKKFGENSIPEMLVLGVVFIIMGTVLTIQGVHQLKIIQADLLHRGVETQAIGADCLSFFGPDYQIRVDGKIYECRGGDQKCPQEPLDTIVYDPDDPGICRPHGLLGRVGSKEKLGLAYSPLNLLAGLLFTGRALFVIQRRRRRLQALESL